MYNDGYGNYIPNAPAAPNFGVMTQMDSQFNSYDFQGAFPPPAPAFNVGISCPAPPGMVDGWIPPPPMCDVLVQEESGEDKLKREGKRLLPYLLPHYSQQNFELLAAVAEEKKRQREGLKKQRDQYISRSEKMKRELKELKQQKSDLSAGHGKRSPSPKTNGFIKENEKLQVRLGRIASAIVSLCLCVFGINQLHTICGHIQGHSVALDSMQSTIKSTKNALLSFLVEF